jgi:hypothetical protein
LLRVEAARAKKLARKLKREESLMIVQTSLAKTEDLEVLARTCLAADSARVKVMVSQLSFFQPSAAASEHLPEPGREGTTSAVQGIGIRTHIAEAAIVLHSVPY